jgi:hypothetical protein
VSDFDDFMVHTVTVDTYTGEGMFGTQYAPTSGPVQCFKDDTRKLVRSAGGDQVVSETTLWIMDKTTKALFVPESIVHLPDRDATVISCGDHDSGDLALPDHLEVALT